MKISLYESRKKPDIYFRWITVFFLHHAFSRQRMSHHTNVCHIICCELLKGYSFALSPNFVFVSGIMLKLATHASTFDIPFAIIIIPEQCHFNHNTNSRLILFYSLFLCSLLKIIKYYVGTYQLTVSVLVFLFPAMKGFFVTLVFLPL